MNPSFILAVVLALSGIVALALVEYMRRTFLPLSTAAELVKARDEKLVHHERMIDRNAGLFVALDDRVGDLEEKAALLEQRQTMYSQQISEQISSLLTMQREQTQEIKTMVRMQHELAIRMERVSRGMGE